MRKLGRREFLLGLGAGTAMAALGPKSWGEFLRPEMWLAGTPAVGSSPVHALNVVIHGMFVVDVGTNGIDLYAVQAPHGSHRYLVGNWLVETPVGKHAHLSLLGVKQGNGNPPARTKLQPDANPVFPRNGAVQGQARFTFHMPFPDNYYFVHRVIDQSTTPFFRNVPKNFVQPKSLPEAVVFTFNSVSGTPTIMEQSGTSPAQNFGWTPQASQGFANLHVWAMNPNAPSAAHLGQTFPIMAKMIGYPSLGVNFVATDIPAIGASSGVPGLPPDEEETLFERVKSHKSPFNARSKPPLNCSSVFLY